VAIVVVGCVAAGAAGVRLMILHRNLRSSKPIRDEFNHLFGGKGENLRRFNLENWESITDKLIGLTRGGALNIERRPPKIL
jgi:hypothetical protein